MRRGNLLAGTVAGRTAERFDELARAEGIRIERIASPAGQRTPGPWYDQGWCEWVLLVEGRAGLDVEGEGAPLELGPGDWLELPPGCRHRVAWTDPRRETVWLAIHFGPGAA